MKKLFNLLGAVAVSAMVLCPHMDVSAHEVTDDIPDVLYESYYQCNWNENPSSYEQLNQMLADTVCASLGLPHVTVAYCDDDPSLHHAYYELGSDCIYVNRQVMYSAQYAFKAIAHELRHVYQYRHSQNPSCDMDYAYKNSFANYRSSDGDYDAYASQLVESDAEAYANRLYLGLIASAHD